MCCCISRAAISGSPLRMAWAMARCCLAEAMGLPGVPPSSPHHRVARPEMQADDGGHRSKQVFIAGRFGDATMQRGIGGGELVEILVFWGSISPSFTSR
jgi:hypothetical protein